MTAIFFSDMTDISFQASEGNNVGLKAPFS